MFLTSLISALNIAKLFNAPPLREDLREEHRTKTAVFGHPPVWKALIGDGSSGAMKARWEELDCKWLKIVEIAETGPQLIDAFEQYKPDIVLIDVRIPRSDEQACLRNIREVDAEAQIVLLTEDASFRSAGEVQIFGATASIPLDSSINEIGEVVQDVLGLRS